MPEHVDDPAEGAGAARGADRHQAESRLTALTVLVPEDARPRSLASVAYYLLRDMVVTLDLEPGAPLDERDLMGRLRLGRTPVREALRRLADEGLVLVYARRGTAVAPVDARDLNRISEVRVELEGLAARLAAERATGQDREQARGLLADLAEIGGPGGDTDPRALIRHDQRVHHWVHRAAHNAYLAATLGEYLTLSLRLWFLGLDRVSRLDEAVREHRDLVDAVLGGDADRAEAVARGHVTAFQEEIRHVLTPPASVQHRPVGR